MLRIYDVALDVLKMLGPVIEEIGRRDSDLARQLRRCGASMVLNIPEGSYARKGAALYGVALGSAKETARASMSPRRSAISARSTTG